MANFGDNTVTPVTLPSLRPGRPIAVGRQPVAVAVSPKGNLALVSNYEDGTVSPIALPALAVGSAVPVGQEPSAVLIAPNGATALVADFQTTTVTPVNLSSMAPGAAIGVGGNPTGIAAAPGSDVAYVSGGDSVTPVNLATLVPGAAINVGTTAEALAVAPGGATAWVCGANGALIHVDLAAGRVINGSTSETSRRPWSSPGPREQRGEPRRHRLPWAGSGGTTGGGPLLAVGGRLDHPERDLPSGAEAQSLVEADGPGIVTRRRAGRGRHPGRPPRRPRPGPGARRGPGRGAGRWPRR